jgi:O-antigen ligase
MTARTVAPPHLRLAPSEAAVAAVCGAVAISIGSGASRAIPVAFDAEITSWLFLLLACAGIARRLHKRSNWRSTISIAEWGCILLLAGGTLAVLANGAPAIPGLLRMVQHVTILVAVASLPATWLTIRVVVTAVIAGVGLQVIVGLAELAAGRTFLYSLWKPIEAATWSGVVRVASTSADPNYFALNLVGTLPLVAALAVLWPRLPKSLALVGVAGWLLLLALTFSRAGYLVLLVLAALAPIVSSRLRVSGWCAGGVRASLGRVSRGRAAGLLAAAVGTGAVAIASGMGTLLLSRLATLAAGSADASLSVRTAAQHAALLVFTEHPIAGIGFDRFVHIGPEYLARVSPHQYQEVNALNSFLLAASEGGFLAAVGFAIATGWSIVWLIHLSVRPPHKSRSVFPASTVAALALGLLAIALMSLTLDGIHAPLQWALLGIAVLCWRWEAAARHQPR